MSDDNGGTRLKELVPGILREDERKKPKDSHEQQLNNEELFYRVQQR